MAAQLAPELDDRHRAPYHATICRSLARRQRFEREQLRQREQLNQQPAVARPVDRDSAPDSPAADG